MSAARLCVCAFLLAFAALALLTWPGDPPSAHSGVAAADKKEDAKEKNLVTSVKITSVDGQTPTTDPLDMTRLIIVDYTVDSTKTFPVVVTTDSTAGYVSLIVTQLTDPNPGGPITDNALNKERGKKKKPRSHIIKKHYLLVNKAGKNVKNSASYTFTVNPSDFGMEKDKTYELWASADGVGSDKPVAFNTTP
jgi:hypothetical protein